MNPYIDNEWYLCIDKTEYIDDWTWIWTLWKKEKRYKVNKEGLFEEVTN